MKKVHKSRADHGGVNPDPNLKKKPDLLGDPEVSANLYCNSRASVL